MHACCHWTIYILSHAIVLSALQPQEEFRAVWIATVWNMDWPSKTTLTSTQQQNELIAYLDIMAKLNMNAVLLQVRPAGDTLYKSELEPWSKFLTGKQGKAPSPLYDPLQFMIGQAHQRGMEVHAWLNPYRANTSPNWNGLAPNHMAMKFREFAYPYSNLLWMDPGAQEITDHLVDVVLDIVNRYDVDGVVFDDYFYPYPNGAPFPDHITWNRYLAGGGQLSRDDWRRDNINRMVQAVYGNITRAKKRTKFGISPPGIYRPGEPGGMPSQIKGFDPYTEIYADTKFWFQKGWLDYWIPQIYHRIDSPSHSYPVILEWWLHGEVNVHKRHVYAANALYKLTDSTSGFQVSEILRQIKISRHLQARLSLGNALFSGIDIKTNVKNVTKILECCTYNFTVGIPEMQWLIPML